MGSMFIQPLVLLVLTDALSPYALSADALCPDTHSPGVLNTNRFRNI